MLFKLRTKKIIFAVSIAIALAACGSSEERAEEHYQRALELVAEGDYDRAIVEFRNVFQINGSHRDARHKLAEVLLEHKKNTRGAYSHYLRLVEQYPDDLKARIALSNLAFLTRDWDEVDRHGAKAEELAPEDSDVKAIVLARAYRVAALEEQVLERRSVAESAIALIETIPTNAVLRNLVIDNHLRDNEFNKALAQLDWMIEQDPENIIYWRQRLSVLAQLGDNSAIEAQLRDMVRLFPDENANKLALVRFYMSRQEVDKAEAFLRELAAAAPADDPGPQLDVIRFLSEVRGIDAARVEVRKAVSAAENPMPFRVMGAGLDFSAGLREDAVAALEDVLETAEPSEQTRAIKVSLARMLLALGNEVGARLRVEEVLAEDARNANALKMRANWLIDSDDTNGAIAALRIAIEEEPEDAQAMTLMASAYTRSGRSELARDYLALAVDASNNAPEETIRYVRILIAEDRLLPAEDLLKKSLRLNQNDPELLVMMGQLYLAMEDAARANDVLRALRNIDTPEATLAADGLEAELINVEKGPEEAMSFLQTIAEDADATLATRVALVRARIATGDLPSALVLAKELAAGNPESMSLKAVLAATEAANGNVETANSLYRDIVTRNPDQSNVWLAMSQLAVRTGDIAEGSALIDEGLTHTPRDANLLWAKASYLERDGDFEAAISIYEGLYEEDSSSIVVANNLASMLTTYRSDDESLERAWRIARRFKEAEVPALQDTYGWIEHRRGNSDVALPYLESAAAALADDPIVQFHLAKTYLALNRPKDALEQFRKVVEITTVSDERPQILEAREQIEALTAAAN